MEELLRLLEQYQAGIADLDDESLGQLLDDIRREAEAAAEGEPTDELIEALGQAADAVVAIEAEVEQRAEADAEATGQVTSLMDRIRGEQADQDADAGDEGGEGDGGDQGDAGDGGGEGEGDGDAGDGDADAVAAAGSRRQRVTRVAQRRPALVHPRQQNAPRVEAPPMQLVAAANLPNIAAGTPLDEVGLARGFIAAYEASKGYRGPRVKIPVARIGYEDAAEGFGQERTLRMSQPQENTRKVDALTAMPAITAAGGRCAPSPINYDLPTVGTDARPVRDDALVRFGADRGGLRTFPPPTIDDVDSGAVATWTNTNDVTPSSPATKPCLTVTCPDDDESIVDAITRCLRFGNFRARFFPEQVQAWTDLVGVWQARYAETKMLTEIGAGSTDVVQGQVLGASVDVLTTLDRAVAAIRNRYRISEAFPLRLVAPSWLPYQIRTDVARRMPGASLDEQFSVTFQTIQGWIESRNVNVTWHLDGETGQLFAAQADNDELVPWPSPVKLYLYPEGSWLFLDGGELDLGIVRDSTLNAVNDFQLFGETWEATHFHGILSWAISLDLCADGSVSGAVDINPCGNNS